MTSPTPPEKPIDTKPELQPGVRVRITQHARDQGISVNAPKGVIIKRFSSLGVTIKRDRFKTPQNYSVSFWEIDRP